MLGFGAAAVSAICSLRECGYDGPLTVVTNAGPEPYSPVLTSYYAGGRIGKEQCFPWKDVDFSDLIDDLLFKQTPVSVDFAAHEVELVDGRRVGYSKLLVATGAHQVTPSAIPGIDRAKGVLDVSYASGKTSSFDFATLAAKHPPKPELRTFETGAVDIKGLVPYNPDGVASKRQNPAGYRGPFTFLQHVRKPGEYVIRFTSTQIGKYAKIEVPVEVYDVNGTPHDTFVMTTPNFDYVLKAQGKNTIYRFEVKPNGRRVSVTSSLAGQGVVANGRVHWLVADNQDVYFQAKAGAGDVKAELTMEPGEWVSAELIDPAGRIVDRCEKRSAGVILVGKRAKDAPSEIWRLHVTKFMDDCHVRLGAATSGVYAHEKDLLLVCE